MRVAAGHGEMPQRLCGCGNTKKGGLCSRPYHAQRQAEEPTCRWISDLLGCFSVELGFDCRFDFAVERLIRFEKVFGGVAALGEL